MSLYSDYLEIYFFYLPQWNWFCILTGALKLKCAGKFWVHEWTQEMKQTMRFAIRTVVWWMKQLSCNNYLSRWCKCNFKACAETALSDIELWLVPSCLFLYEISKYELERLKSQLSISLYLKSHLQRVWMRVFHEWFQHRLKVTWVSLHKEACNFGFQCLW